MMVLTSSMKHDKGAATSQFNRKSRTASAKPSFASYLSGQTGSTPHGASST